jgi:ketosteroid isomerase-like protein
MARDIEPGAGSAKPASAFRPDATVQEFFDRFAHALTSGDTPTVASMWETPAFVLGDQDAQVVTAREEIEQFFSGAKEYYNAQGIADTRPEIFKLEWVTDRIVIVEVRWPYLDAQGKEAGEESSTYTLRRDDSGELKLRVVVMHGAVETH